MKATSLHTKPEVVSSHRCSYREIVYDVINRGWLDLDKI